MIKNENGRSMIEMLGVLAIIGVLSVGGIAGYSKAMMKYKVNKTIEQITHTAAAIKTAYMQQPQTHIACDDYNLDDCWEHGKYAELDSPTAIAIGAVSDEMISESGDSLQNVFGGIVNIFGVYASEDLNLYGTGFAIDYRGVPKEACIALATYDWTGVFQGLSIEKIEGMPGYALILSDAANCYDNSGYYSQEGYAWVAQGCKSNPINRVTLSPADAALGCSCEDNLCDIAFVTND